ncbi:MAG TPA: TonB-dependent receptor [Granulicella sp.]
MLSRLFIAVLCLSALPAVAQKPSVTDAITVSTTVEPLPLSESDRAINQIDAREQPTLFNNATDLLRLDPSVNLQARAANGVQADLSLRGTTFEQSLVLLNGFRINDAQASHFNLELPIPFEAVSRIDVLHGSGSTFYGSDAIGGAINMITVRPARTALLLKAGFGNYGSEEQHLRADYVRGRFAGELSGSRDTSNGFIADRGYHANALAAEGWLMTGLGTTDILLAGSDRPYGANQFYGNYDSWERTKAWFGSIQQQLGARTAASFGYQRHTDLFVLLLDQPNYYRNNHITTSYEAALRRTDTLGSNVTLSYGLEETGDAIDSSNLGQHARNEGAGYASLSLRSLKRLSLSLGAREEVLSGNGSVFSPSVAAGYALTSSLRLRGAIGHGFRLPTYTDLYYSDPANIGNPALKPESSWSYEAGIDWNPGGRVSATATVFRLQEKDTIDYSKYSLAAPWQATNVQGFHITGAEAALKLRLSATQRLELSYTAARAGQPPAGLISEYAFNYAAQSALAAWTGELFHQVTGRMQVAVIQRTTHTAYPLWDLSLARSKGYLRPYVRLLNLNNTGYEEIPGVPLQGRTIMAGAEFHWASKPH